MLLRRVERFLSETRMPWTRFGRLAARDPRLVDDLRQGRHPRPSTEGRIEGFMAGYRAARQEVAHAR